MPTIMELPTQPVINSQTNFLVAQNGYSRRVKGSAVEEFVYMGVTERIADLNREIAEGVSAAEIADARSVGGTDYPALGAAIRAVDSKTVPQLLATYTEFDGGVVDTGSVSVARYGHLCFVFGNLQFFNAVSAWTELLDYTKVPPRLYGGSKFTSATNTTDSAYSNSLALRTQTWNSGTETGGGLAVRYGAGKRYDFELCYIADWGVIE